jgi:hypothetical protein
MTQSFFFRFHQKPAAPRMALALGGFGGENMAPAGAEMPDFPGGGFPEAFHERFLGFHLGHGISSLKAAPAGSG